MADNRPTVSSDPLDRVSAILRDGLLVPAEEMDGHLIEQGSIDSADFLDLFLLLEEEFGLKIEAGDLALENFATRHAIAAFVSAKLAAAQ